MFRLIKQVFIVLFSFSSSLATTCLSLNDEACMVRATLIDSNPAERKYLLMISLDKCNKRYNVLSPKTLVPPKETKDINVEVFDMTATKNEAKAMTKQFHLIVNVNSIV